MAVDASGTLHVAWPTMVDGERSGKGVFYSYSSDGGRTFAPRLRVDDARRGANHPQLAVAGTRVSVVWDGGMPRRAYLREVSREPRMGSGSAAQLGAVLAFGGGDRSATYPAVAATHSSLVVAWTETAHNVSEIRVQRNSKD